MFRRGVCFSIVSALLSAATPAAAVEPLMPIKAWLVNYDTAECTAQRSYGDAANPTELVLGPTAWGDNFELLVVTKGQGPHNAEQSEGSVDFGQGSNKAWLLHYGIQQSALNILKFRITSQEMEQAKNAASVKFHAQGRPDVTFALTSVPALLTELGKCTTNLQHYWNMTAAEQKVIAAPPVGDLRGIFSAEDYPDEASARDQEGSAQFLLFIDEQGKVAACHVLKPSGIPVFDGMGCQVILRRAKFSPALDRNGKPIRSAYVPPPISWRFSD